MESENSLKSGASPEGVQDDGLTRENGGTANNAEQPFKYTEISSDPGLNSESLMAALSAGGEPRGMISAATVAQLMGLATVTDLKLVSSKVDLMMAKVSGMTVRLEKVLTIMNAAPTGSDLERIDVQIGALRGLIREVLTKLGVSFKDEALAAPGGKGNRAARAKPNEEEPAKT